MERQIHGFDYQDKKILELKKNPTKYNAKFDTEDGLSFKCIRVGGSIDMGDLYRFYDADPFTMYIGWHVNKKVVKEEVLDFTQRRLNILRGAFVIEEIIEIVNKLRIKNFPRGKHEEAKKWAKQWKLDNAHKMGLLTFNHKVDSKSQRRWQCSINQTAYRKLFK